MKIDNIVIGSSIKALMYAYKKGFYFLPCRDDIEPFFHEYMDYSYTYMQFGINDKKPNSFKTNRGYKLYGPHKRQLYDLLLYDMILSGRVLYLNVKKTVFIEGKTISITSFNGHSVIEFDTLHVFEIGDIQTDFSKQKYKKFLVFDWFTKDKKFGEPSEELDLIYLDKKDMRRVYNLPEHIVIMSRHSTEQEVLEAAPASKMFELYEPLSEYGFDLLIQQERREIHEISKHDIIVKRSYVKLPDIPMIKLLESHSRKSPILSVKKLEYASGIYDKHYSKITERNNGY